MELSALPTECIGNVLAFLSLPDCLQFGRTSRRSLQVTLPDLYRRRRLLIYSDSYTSCDSDASKLRMAHEQAQALCELLPRSYPTHGTACELLSELSSMLETTEEEGTNTVITPDSQVETMDLETLSFDALFERQQKLLRMHRLYVQLLSSTLQRRDLRWGYPTAMSCSLVQYVGDVLVHTYLLDYRDLELVPTTTSLAKWLSSSDNDGEEEQQQQPITTHNANEAALLSYRTWVFLHSRILRKRFFTSAQRDRLRVSHCFSWSTDLLPRNCRVPKSFLDSTATLVLDDFAPLRGGAYRGRDRIRFRDMTGRQLLDFLKDMRPEQHVLQTFETVDWLCLVHEEARKTRPMTVREPVVRFS